MNILIVEDEYFTATLLQEIIEQDTACQVVARLESVTATVSYLAQQQAKLDLLFFDIQLADGKSFEIFKHVDVVVPVIFCTAYDEFALQAIQSNAIDYVLKPFCDDEIHAALVKYKKLVTHLRQRQFPSLPIFTMSPPTFQRSFLTYFRGKSVIKNVNDIALFAVENEVVYFYTFAAERYPLFKKLEYVESVCDPQQFFRINRQMLIQRRSIVTFEPAPHRKIVLQLKVMTTQAAVVSRLKVSIFKKWLEKGHY